MADTPRSGPSADLWTRALDGDRDAFEEAIDPHRDTLIDAARRKIAAREAEGQLAAGSLTAEELAGETLIRAFDGRDRYDADRMSFRAWLLGLQFRALNRLSDTERTYNEQKAISLDAPVPATDEQDAVEEDFYEFYQPFDVTTYEEMIPGQAPGDVEIDPNRSLTQDELDYLESSGLSADQRQLVEFHDEFDLTLPEIAQIMEYSLQDTAEGLGEARVHLRQYIGSTDVENVTDDDPIDSYTGEPISENPTQPNYSNPSDNDTTDRA